MIQFEEVFDRPIEAVWQAITTPRLLARWLMENDFEPRVGHAFTLRETPSSHWRGVIACKVLELTPPRRMVWSWNGAMPGEETTRVVFELTAEGERTRLVFRHEGPVLLREGAFRSGWARRLRALRDVAGTSYARRIVVAASTEALFDAVATVEGLRGWWTPIVEERGVERILGFEGMDERIVMRVEEETRPCFLRWTCVRHTSLPEWANTTLTFDIVPRGEDASEVLFCHVGLEPKLACYEDCEQGWDFFLESMRDYVQSGVGKPFRGHR